VANVNGMHFPIVVRECHDIDTCNGGTCFHGDLLYDGEFACNCTATQRGGPFCLSNLVTPLVATWNEGSREAWAEGVFGQPYFQAPPTHVVISGGTNSSHDKSVTYLANGLPCGIVMDAATGALSGTSRDPVASANVTVIAIGSSGEAVTVNNAPFQLTIVDCHGATTCNGGMCVDETPFDGVFSCNCNETGRQGNFCTIAMQQQVPAVITDSKAVIAISACFGAVALLIATVLAVRRYALIPAATG